VISPWASSFLNIVFLIQTQSNNIKACSFIV
jgi:hypothetical protein